jgi:hypothetical protein
MKSFAVRLEPGVGPRLAAAVLLLHALSAVAPWIARVPAPLAAALSVIALAALAHSVSRLPGRHCRLAAARYGRRGWQVRLAGTRGWMSAELHGSSRAYQQIVFVAFRADGSRFGWLLSPESLPAAHFRRLKALVRLAC